VGSIPTEGSQLRRRSSVGESIRLIIGRSPVRIRSPLQNVDLQRKLMPYRFWEKDFHPSTIQKALVLLTKREKSTLAVLAVLNVLGVVLETLSLGLVVPIVGFLTRDDALKNYEWLNSFLGNPVQSTLVLMGLLSLCILYTAKTLLIMWVAWLQKSFNSRVNLRIGNEMYSSYLNRDYPFFLGKNSADLIKNIQGSNGLMIGTIEPLLSILSDSLVGIVIVGLLIYLEPIGTILILFLFGLAAIVLRKYSSERINKWSNELHVVRGTVIKSLQQGFGGIKDIKTLRREDFFVQDFGSHYQKSLEILQKFAIIQMFPRAILEVITIYSVSVLVIFMVMINGDNSSVLPVLGLFGVAAFRVAPAINRLITNFQLINASRPQITETYSEIARSKENTDSAVEHLELESLLIENVTFRYEGSTIDALCNLSANVEKGEAVGFIGQSGSGKSTLIDLLLGLLRPESGVIRINGQNIVDVKPSWQAIVGYIPQTIFLMDDSLRRNIAIGIADNEIDEVAVREALKSAQLEDFVASLPEGLDTVVGERGVRLSGGQRQRIGIARALYHRPSVLVLDEATSSLDTETEHEVMKAVQALQGDKTVIIVAHRLSTVEYCDRLYRLDAGRIVDEGTFDEVMNRSQS
jgi:ATP-binding cassette, subfamily B, bacterial PglK